MHLGPCDWAIVAQPVYISEPFVLDHQQRCACTPRWKWFWHPTKSLLGCECVCVSPLRGRGQRAHTRTKTETYFYGDELRLPSDKHAVSYSWLQRCCGILWLSHHGARQERQRRLDNSIPEARIKSESLLLTIAE